MKKITELKDDDLLVITPEGQDGIVMDKKEFLQSHYYLDKDKIAVSVAEERFADFDLGYALEALEDDMHEDWLGNVLDAIPKEVRERIETEINSYLQKEPTYYPEEIVSWID